MSAFNSTDLLLLAPEDNCLVACRHLNAGTTVWLDGQAVVLPQAVPLGYKVARYELPAEQFVWRYGAFIGSTTQVVHAGELLHVHNLKSHYLPHVKH
jgi:altronate dehydratase small subunit